MARGPFWTKEEDLIVMEGYRNNLSIRMLSQKIGRSIECIWMRAQKLKVARERGFNGERVNPVWLNGKKRQSPPSPCIPSNDRIREAMERISKL